MDADSQLKWCNWGRHYVARCLFYPCPTKPDGLTPTCSDCLNAKGKQHYGQRKERGVSVERKTCKSCSRNLAADDFYKNPGTSDGLFSSCISCVKARRDANREEIRARAKEFRTKNRDKIREADREYCKKNRARAAARSREWYAKHKERAAEWGKGYRARNKEAIAERERRYAAERPVARQIAKRNYKARKKSAEGCFTSEEWLAKCEYHGWRCYLCGRSVNPQSAHAEHRIPLARGGSNWIANIAPSCAPCNLSKNKRTEKEFREFLGFEALPLCSGLLRAKQ